LLAVLTGSKPKSKLNGKEIERIIMKFAHISDCHLGAWQHNEKLCELNLQAFLTAMDICLKKRVDFVLTAGDLFNTPTPDLSIVEIAVRKVKELKDAGIEFYMILGSHDYSPNVKSITDVLSSAGFIATIMDYEERDGRLVLNFIRDPKTDALLAGLSGKRRGEDAEDFPRLDTRYIQGEKGFKIFAFHNYLSGIAPSEIPGIPSLSLENLPRGFDYYAGGHAHKKQQYDSPSYKHVVHAGTLFGCRPLDLKMSASGERRGFYIVTAEDDNVTDIEFCEVRVCEVVSPPTIDIEGMDVNSARAKIKQHIGEMEVDGKVVLLEIKGRLSEGRPYQIHFQELEDELMKKGAKTVLLDRRGVAGQAMERASTDKEISQLEAEELGNALRDFDSSLSALKGEAGLALAQELLQVLSAERGESQTKKAYEERMVKSGQDIIDRRFVQCS
jgi:hypothetical protein